MGTPLESEVVVRIHLLEQMRDDLRILANIDGISLKAVMAKLVKAELDARSTEIKELKAKRSKRNPPITD